jgi:BatD DUF11 like domain
MIGKKIALLLSISCCTTLCLAQAIVSTTIDKDSILIGEQITYTTTIKGGVQTYTNPQINFPKDAKGYEVVKNNGAKTVSGEVTLSYTLTSFDSGKISIPAIIIEKNLTTKAVSFYVKTLKIDTIGDYKDIKPIVAADSSKTDYRKYIVMLAIALALILLAFILKNYLKKKPTTKTIVKYKLSAYEEAITHLKQLEHEKWVENEQYKTYFKKLDEIVKQFYFRKEIIPLVIITNDELRMAIKKDGLHFKENITLLQQLQMSSFVQFAQYEPTAQQCKQAIDTYKSSIDFIETKTKANAV